MLRIGHAHRPSRMIAPVFTLSSMQADDIPAVMAIQRASFAPELVEDEAVITNRFQRFGEHFLMAWKGADRQDGQAAGYALCFPWKLGEIPGNNKPFPPDLPAPDAFFLQDISLAPEARGHGLSQIMLAHMIAHAAAQDAASFSLVAVGQTGGYWDRQGFRQLENMSAARIAYVRSQYGEGARLMYRELGRT